MLRDTTLNKKQQDTKTEQNQKQQIPKKAVQRTHPMLYYNGDDTKRNGVAIAVAQLPKDYVSAVSRISDQIMAVRIDTKEGYGTVLSEYAPQAGRPCVKDGFVEKFEIT
ncbi:hypothetical protein TELCIR_19581 [Teladorsagia circumcincta]|uniref:Uncharacterized protein n=1 Tax=Teladorsagia circumcincta TaxID=45464 RepID=A0A2G9TM46_TELCI|nr:hypothetical protein TELCIR_19581 [Teladorsagia circumcincta]